MDLFGSYQTDEMFIQTCNEFINNFINKEIILWGKSKILPTFFKFCNNLNIKYIVDKNKNLNNSSLNNISIHTPDILKNESPKDTRFIITLSGCDFYDIKSELISKGFSDTNICSAYDYLIADNILNNEKLILPNLELIITTVCTLKCKHCIAKIPYFQKDKIYAKPFDNLKKEIDDIFANIDYIGYFQLATGEVLSHPELEKIIQYIATNYHNQYRDLTFVTNGTIVPNTARLEALSKYVDFIQISPYRHKDLNNKLHSQKISELFKQYNINHFYSHYATGREEQMWNDIGDLITPKNRDDKDNIYIYHNCHMNVCKCISDGIIYPCTAACYSALKGDNKVSEENLNRDFVKISSPKIDIARYYLKASNCNYPAICDKCNGIGPLVNKNMVCAGEQL